MIFRIRARLSTGHGQGQKFVNYPWVREQIQDKFGFIPYPGTLNLLLDESSLSAFQHFKQTHDGISIRSINNECKGLCYTIQVNNVNGIAVIPQVPDYPQKQLEIIAPINLRTAFSLKDGDEIEVFFTDY